MAAAARPSSAHSPLPVPAPWVEHHFTSALQAPMREWAEKKRIPPVLLLTGPAGVGKRSMAYWLSQWVLCERGPFSRQDPASGEEGDLFGGALLGAPPAATQPSALPAPCGECRSCERAVSGSWVDFTEVGAESEGAEGASGGTRDGTGALKVDQFRRLKGSLGFAGHEGSHRITLIPNADRMTVQAANSMLKLLEEPPPGWIFLLTASDPSLMLPTVLSRCQMLRLRPIPRKPLLELLAGAGVPESRRRVCAELSQGSLGKALQLAADEAWEKRAAIFRFLQDPAAHLNELVDWASGSATFFELMLDQLEQLASELVRFSLAPEGAPAEGYPWISSDGKQALAAHAAGVLGRYSGSRSAAREHWLALSERLARARQESLAPLNRKLLVQDLLMPWLELAPKR